jgi:glycogen synthase
MKIGILTNEYPPHVYGGAGVHVEYLTRELARLDGGAHEVKVISFGDQNSKEGGISVKGVAPRFDFPASDSRHRKVFDPLLRNLVMAGALDDVDVVHCHTWYSHFAGCLCRQLLEVPLVLTTHSLEPHRPWKVEQLGTGYSVSTWLERTAYQNADGVVAVSRSMSQDVQDLYGVEADRVRVIYNGIDLDQYKAVRDDALLAHYGLDPAKPILLFVGRITRQKGIIHLVRAIPQFQEGVQVVLCAGAPDTPEIGKEMEVAVAEAKAKTRNTVVWIPEMLSKEKVIALYSHATVFVCPSVYEPFGIINLEAMACSTPVVASAVGGILEVVVPGETGLLVPTDAPGGADFEPRDPEQFSRGLADAVNQLLADPARAEAMGKAGRRRVEDLFSWTSIARQTLEFYNDLINKSSRAS